MDIIESQWPERWVVTISMRMLRFWKSASKSLQNSDYLLPSKKDDLQKQVVLGF
jgi:hypothetical protein